jgi:hypothetical protein
MYKIDNTDRDDIERTILWQYDNATNLIAIIGIFKDFFKDAVTDFWNEFITEHTDLFVDDKNISNYGLALWGKAIGVPRLVYDNNGTATPINAVLYRNVLKARLILSTKAATLKDYSDFITSIFGKDRVVVVDAGRMSLSVVKKNDEVTLTADEKALIDNVDAWFLYPAGVKSDEHSNSNMLGFDGQEPVESTDPNIGVLDEVSFNWRLTPGGNWNE